MKKTNSQNKTAQKGTLPPWIIIEGPGDVNFGQLFSPVDAKNLVGRRCSPVEVLQAVPSSDRAEVKEAMTKGVHPVLIIDLESGSAALEMREYIPPSEFPPLTSEQKEFFEAQTDCLNKLLAFKSAIIREAVALGNNRYASRSNVKKARK